MCINICKFEVYYALCIEDYGWYIERLALLCMFTLIIRKNKHEIVKNTEYRNILTDTLPFIP